MDFKIILLILLVILLVLALVKKLIFLAVAVVILGFAYYTGLAEAAILFLRELVSFMPSFSSPPALMSLLINTMLM